MNKITKPADFAGLVPHAVPLTATGYVGCGEITAQPAFQPVHRREIMAAVNTCRRDLGLSPGTLVTLDALLSCLPCPAEQNGQVTHKMLLTIYASNETLCFRAKGITDRQLRRHIEMLEKAGLVLRRLSRNGKRFPILRNGQVAGAFGLDLTPLFLRAAELLEQAKLRREQDQELRGLRARLKHLCAHLLEHFCDDTIHHFIKLARRASLTLTEAQAAIRYLTEIIPVTVEQDPVESAQKPASAGHFDRLNNPESKPLKRTSALEDPEWGNFTEISTLFSQPASEKEARETASLFGQMLGLQPSVLSKAITDVPVLTLLTILDHMAGKIDKITSPSGYLREALSAAQGRSGFTGNFLTKLRPQMQYIS